VLKNFFIDDKREVRKIIVSYLIIFKERIWEEEK